MNRVVTQNERSGMQDNGRIVTIIQARMQSSRLPGKVLMDIAGRPMLGHLISRIRNSETG